MKLKEFVEKFICKNTLIRLWVRHNRGHKMLEDNSKDVCMEWELLQNKVWQSKYNECEIVGITDILTDTYKEAVNIVINIT